MGNFKQVLEIEKKYDHIISSARQKHEKRLEKLHEELRLKEEAYKNDCKKELDREYKKELKNFKLKGEDLVKKAEDESDFIEKNSNVSGAVKMLVEEFKNV